MILRKKKYRFFSAKLVLVTMLFLFHSSHSLFAQNPETNNEQVKRLQRAIFIFNFAQQVGWQNLENLDTFKIGVLGPDRTILDLQSLSQSRKIFGKPVEIVRFQRVKNIKDVQLLYVNQKYNYEIQYVLSKISGKQILLVSEDYNYNSSMINMVNVGDSFEYEINSGKLEKEGFVVSPSLPKYAISSSQKWKQLYKASEKSLEETREENKEQKSVISGIKKQIENQSEQIGNQQEEIDKKKAEITQRNEIIQNLYTESHLQQKKYEEKLLIERELEKNIKEQVAFIKQQETKIEASNQEIEKQSRILKRQQQEIEVQNKTLTSQKEEIDLQKQLNILLISLVALVLLVGVYVYRNYVIHKRLTKELEKRNQEISQQALELESKNNELEQFAYIASHDLQEPLNTISSFIGLITEDYGDSFDDVGKESLTFIQDASVRMKNLIDALLQYSRLGRAKEYTNVDCNEVLEEIQKDLKTVIDRTGAKIQVDRLLPVHGNAVELRLLFQNLISNAMKFIREGITPEISISAHKKQGTSDQKDYITFSVKDNGIGIPKEHQQRIFAIFQRLHSRDKYKGTGIGLAHCKKIVESHGGEIWLTSEEGKGSIFYFTIPAS